ncbi:MAG TPA: tetratricopeptide repeat protein [Ardenticatenaceae bacterium]
MLPPPPIIEEASKVEPQPTMLLPVDRVPDYAALPAGSRMVLRRNKLFTGREEDLWRVAEALETEETAAITGIGGLGKTQLAAEFVHRYGQFFEGGVFWLSFASAEAVPTEVASCGGVAGMKLREDFTDVPLDRQVELVEAVWREATPRLLVFDNCEEEALLGRWRPTTGGCRVLLTARRPEWSATLGVKAVPLDELTREQSVALLKKYRTYPPEEEGNLKAIAGELGDLPLALHLAGSFLAGYEHSPSIGSPAAYLEKIRSTPAVDHLSMKGEGAHESPTKHDQDVSRTFQVSYERLDPVDEMDSLALRLLAYAAYFAPGEPIPRWLLVATLELEESSETDLRPEKALNRLANLGLIEKEADGALVLHRLLAGFARGVTVETEAQDRVERVLEDEAWRINNAGYPAPLLAWQAHLRFVTDVAEKRGDEQAARLCTALDYHLDRIGDYRGARFYSKRALTILEKVLGSEHPNVALSLNNLAELLRQQGDYAGAKPLFERALAIREKVLGPEHRETATSLNNLAVLLHQQGDYARAKPLYERALAIREKVLGSEHPDTAVSFNNLAELLRQQGDYAGAKPLYERALRIQETVLGLEHPDTAQILNNLAALLYQQSDYASAKPLYDRALMIQETVLGLEHPDTAQSLNNLAALLYYQGDYAGAQPLFERAFAILEKVLGPEHPHTRLARANLEELLSEMDH